MVEKIEEARRRAYGEELGKERWRVGWLGYWGRKFFPWILLILIIIGVIWLVRSVALREIVGTRVGVALEKSEIPGRITVGLRDAVTKTEAYIKGFGEWKAPGAKEKKEPRGIKIVEVKPRRDLPYRMDEEVEVMADVKVYMLDKEDFGSSKISFECKYEDGSSGRIIIDGVEQNEVYAANNKEENFNARCILPGVSWESEEEAIIRKVDFYASYDDFSTTSTLHAGVLGEQKYLEEKGQGTLIDFFRRNSAYPNLINMEGEVVSEYTKGPVKLALVSDKQPLTENRIYSFFISYMPEISEWTGEINLISMELSRLPAVFQISKCDLESEGIWVNEDLAGCEDGCERACDFNVVNVDEFVEYDVKARAIYDYTVKGTTSVTIRKVTTI